MFAKSCIFCFLLLCCSLPVVGDDAAKKNEISVCGQPELNLPYFITLWQEEVREYNIGIKGTPNGAAVKQTSEMRLTGVVTWLRLPSPMRSQTIIEIKVSTFQATNNGRELPLKHMEGKSFRVSYNKDKSFSISELNNNAGEHDKELEKGERLLVDAFAPDNTSPENLLGSKLYLAPKTTWDVNTDFFVNLLSTKKIDCKKKNWTIQGIYRGIAPFQGIDCHDVELSAYSMYIPCYDCKINVQYQIPVEGNPLPISMKKQILEIIDHVMPDTEQIFTGTSFLSILRHRGEIVLIPQSDAE